jgi:hypothetical protein
MGLETRRGNLYYYRKRRDGARVVSEYVGGGHVAALCSQLDAAERAEGEAKRAALRGEREAGEALDNLLDAIGAALKTAAACELTAAGCHKHRGQWRVIRGGKKD